MNRRLPIYLLIDCSESMAGPAIDAVSQGVNALVNELRMNPQALETAHLSLITFSRYAKQVVPLTEVMHFIPPKLSVRPGTALGAALDLLMHCVGREVVKTTPTTKGDYRPLVFLMTDGQPTDSWERAANTIRSMHKPSIANVYAIGCGPDVDTGMLRQLTDIVLVMPDLTPEKIRKVFVWLSASVQTASERIERVGEQPLGLESLPAGVLEAAPITVPNRDPTPRQVFLHARCSKTKKPYLMRYIRRPHDGHYEPVTSHPLEEFTEGDAALLPPINSSALDGCPSCPYCGNVGGGMCGCGALFCTSAQSREPLICPKCNAQLTVAEGDFDIQRSEG